VSCAALLASLGFALADVDHHKVYEVKKSYVSALPATTQWLAKACARRNGVRWKIVP
jgi:hypothetical protein